MGQIDQHVKKLQDDRALKLSHLQCICGIYIYLRNGAVKGRLYLRLLEAGVEAFVPIDQRSFEPTSSSTSGSTSNRLLDFAVCTWCSIAIKKGIKAQCPWKVLSKE
jgi:hypothetical protein